MRFSFGLLLFICIGVPCAKAENDNPEPLKGPVQITVEAKEQPNNGNAAPAPAAVESVQNAKQAGEDKAKEISPRMLLASRKIARAPPVEPEVEVPDPIKEDEPAPVFVPQSVKVITPTRRGQPNKIQRVKQVLDLVGKTPLSDLQKEPAKLKEFMKPTSGKTKPTGDSIVDREERPVQKPKVPKKRPTPSAKKPSEDSTVDREERPVQKPKLPKKFPTSSVRTTSGDSTEYREERPVQKPKLPKKLPTSNTKTHSGDSTVDRKERPVQKPKLPKKLPIPTMRMTSSDSIEDREERPVQKPKVPEKRPAVFEQKPAKLPKSVKVPDDITIVPEDLSSENRPPVAKPKFVHPVQTDHGYAKKVRPIKSKPPKPIIVKDISATYSSEEQRPVFKPKSIRKPKKFVPDTSRSCSAESFSCSCSQERCQDSCESSEEWGRFPGYCFDLCDWGRFGLCGRCFDSCESGSGSCSSSNSCESGSASCGCSNSSESGSASCGCSCSCGC